MNQPAIGVPIQDTPLAGLHQSRAPADTWHPAHLRTRHNNGKPPGSTRTSTRRYQNDDVCLGEKRKKKVEGPVVSQAKSLNPRVHPTVRFE